MNSVMLKRLKRLEGVRAIEDLPPEFQTGYLMRFPAAYTRDRHLVRGAGVVLD